MLSMSVQLNAVSQSEHSCDISAYIKKWDTASRSEASSRFFLMYNLVLS